MKRLAVLVLLGACQQTESSIVPSAATSPVPSDPVTETIAPLTPVISTVSTVTTIGDGSAGNPYQISTVAELQAISDGNYELEANINASTITTIPTFAGTLDGQGFTLSGLHQPLFNRVSGTIENLNLASAVISSSGVTAALVGTLDGTLSNISLGNLGTATWTGFTWNVVGNVSGASITEGGGFGIYAAMGTGIVYSSQANFMLNGTLTGLKWNSSGTRITVPANQL